MAIQLSQQKNKIKKKIQAIILCAGEGVRIKEHYKEIPKALIPIPNKNDIPILKDTINKLKDLGISIEEALKSKYKRKDSNSV